MPRSTDPFSSAASLQQRFADGLADMLARHTGLGVYILVIAPPPFAMPRSTDPFSSAASLQQRFADGLADMLARHTGLGVYILVLANAAYDARLWAQLSPALSERHAELADAIARTLRRGQPLAEPDDDVLVFLKLHAIGLDCLEQVQSRRVGPWQVLFNPLRALRPPRISGLKFDGLQRPFDTAGFHFNKPFLARETFWEGDLAGKSARILYNKFPFARLHGLLVPEPLRERSQYLTPELHCWAWDICTRPSLPGLCLGYNSYGAGASVNHLHFQSFVQSDPLPIQDTRFIHNGGVQTYPLPCLRFADREAAWFHLDRLHQQNRPYNLIYSQTGLYLVARVPQDSETLDGRSRGFGWSEMAGTVTRFSRDMFDSQTAADFETDLTKFAP